MKKTIISDQISMDFEEALLKIENHFQYVEIHSLWNKTVEELDDDEAREVEALLKKHGVRVSCLSTTLFLMCPLYTGVQSLERFNDTFLVFTGDVSRHTECLKKCIELSSRFDTEYIRIFPFRLEKGIDRDFDFLIADMKDTLDDAVILAEKEKKCLLLENCPYSYLPRGAMTCELAESIGSNHLMLLYDVGNSFTSADRRIPDRFKHVSLIDEYGMIKERVRYFHFKDYRQTKSGFQHAVFGEGDVGYQDMYHLINKDGGDRIVSLEPEVEGNELELSITNFVSLP